MNTTTVTTNNTTCNPWCTCTTCAVRAGLAAVNARGALARALAAACNLDRTAATRVARWALDVDDVQPGTLAEALQLACNLDPAAAARVATWLQAVDEVQS